MLDSLQEELGGQGKVRLLMHSIAFGNLKLIAPEEPPSDEASERLADRLGIEHERLREAADELFEDGVDGMEGIASAPEYSNERFLEDADVARTIYANTGATNRGVDPSKGTSASG